MRVTTNIRTNAIESAFLVLFKVAMCGVTAYVLPQYLAKVTAPIYQLAEVLR